MDGIKQYNLIIKMTPTNKTIYAEQKYKAKTFKVVTKLVSLANFFLFQNPPYSFLRDIY